MNDREYEQLLNNNYNKDSNENNSFKSHKYSVIKIIFIIIGIIIFISIILAIIIFKNSNKNYSVKFNLNGADELNQSIINCKSDIFGHCYVIMPTASRYDGEVLGYSNDATSETIEYKINEKIDVTDNMNLYVVSRKKYTLNIDMSEIDELSTSNSGLSCYSYNTDNSVCDVVIPQFNKKGYSVHGYVETKGSQNQRFFPGETHKASGTLYPIYSIISEIVPNIDIKESFFIDKAYVDVENSCPDDVVTKYTDYLKEIEKKAPFLFNYQKIIFHGDKEFFKKNIFGGEYSFALTNFCGSNGNCDSFKNNTRSSVINCNNYDNAFDEYLSIIHELFHSADSRYNFHFGKYISDEDDVTQLYNNYRDSSLDKCYLPTYDINNKPLRFYAYGSEKEFFSELMTFYYINYIDTNYKIKDIDFEKKSIGFGSIIKEAYFRGNFPDDMKKVAEKYYCILENNFDKNKCS